MDDDVGGFDLPISRMLTLCVIQQLGTFGRAKRKVDELQRVIAESRRATH
jgi:hypothetical protein